MSSNKSLSNENQSHQIQLLSDEELILRLPILRASVIPEIIPLLVEKWYAGRNDRLNESIYNYFLDSKVREELPYFMEAIRSESFAGKRNELIAILWQSSLDASDHLKELIEIALKGNYMTLVEVSTVIETFENIFSEELLSESLLMIDKAMEGEGDEDRLRLIGNLREITSELHSG